MGIWNTSSTTPTKASGSLWDSTPTPPIPFVKAPTKTVSTPSFTALAGGASGTMKTSTPAVAAPGSKGTIDFLKSALKTTKDVFAGGDQTTGGIIRNTIIGIPKASVEVGKNVVKGLKDSVTNPDAEQKDFENQMLPYAPKSSPVTRVLTAPGVAAARFITRVVNPGIRPFANDIAEIYEVNRKGGFADQVASGTLPASYLDELAVLHKTAPQIVGDVAQFVLTAYSGSGAAGMAEKSAAIPFKTAVKTGFKSGLMAGESFGLAQAMSQGQTNPFEILGTIGTSGGAGGILGAIISGTIPATKEVVAKAKEAKILYDSMTPAQRQGGYIKNPLGPKQIDNLTKNELIDSIDYLRDDKRVVNEKMEQQVSALAQKYGVSEDLSSAMISNRFEKLINETKTVDINPKKVISSASQEKTGSGAVSERPTMGGDILPRKTSRGELPQEQTPRSQQPVAGRGTKVPNIEESSYAGNVPQDFNPDKYVQEMVASREGARVAGKPGVIARTKSVLSDIKAKLVDFTAPIEDVLRKATKENDIKLLPSEDIHNQIDRVLRAPTLAGQFAKDHGIIEVIRKIDNPDALDQYLIAKHAVELDERGIKTGRNIPKDQALIDAYASKYEAPSQIVSGYAEKLLDYSVQTGLISKELAAGLKARYPDYVPFSRVFNELEKANGYGTNAVASLSKQTAVQKIIGSEREIESPLRSLLSKTNDVFKQGEKNVAGKLLAGYEKLPGNPFELKELKGGETAPHTISFFDKGEKRVFSTTKEIAQAAKSLNVQQLNILGKILAFPTRIARLGITGINLPFVGANLAKDQISAFINSNHGLRTSIANPVNFVRGLFSAVAHDGLYQEMVRAGGAGTSFDIARNQVENTFASVRGETKIPFTNKTIDSKILYTVTHPGELLRAVENIINRGEEATRIQQYRGTKEALKAQGLPESEAIIGGARGAREGTVNFARRGEWGAVLNNAFLYLNAGIQGTRTLLGNLRDKPIATSAKIAVSAMFPVAVATAWNLKDPERRAAYEDIAEYEKENNIIIIPPNPTKDANGKWNVIKIPLSQEINNIVGLARKPIEQAAGLDPLKFGDFAQALLGTISPVAPTKGSLLSTAVPQAIKPTIEGITNQSLFTGFPQVPKSLEGLPNDQQVKEDTSGTVRIIANKLNLSPIKVQEWIKGTFGGVGSQALNAVDQALAQGGVIPKDEIGGQSVLDGITARFGKASGGQQDQKAVSELQTLVQSQAGDRYDLKLEAQKLDRALAAMPKEAANAKVAEIKQNNPQLFAKLQDVVEQRKLNLDYSEKLMLQLGVSNGARAKYVNSQILKLPDSETRNAYLQELIDKKIVTEGVLEQLKKLRK